MSGEEFLAWEEHLQHTPPLWKIVTLMTGYIWRLMAAYLSKDGKVPKLEEVAPWLVPKPKQQDEAVVLPKQAQQTLALLQKSIGVN